MSGEQHVSLRERVKAPPAAELVAGYYAPAVAGSIRYVFRHEMRIHLAHALMLEQRGIVARKDIAATLRVLLKLIEQGPNVLAIDYSQEDLYSYIERYIVAELGPDVGGRLHTGRSRNDLNITSWRLALRERLLDVFDALNAVRRVAVTMAEAHRETVMPGYTHSQHAQPITLGYYLLSVADVLARDFTRLAGALAHTDLSPLGAGALSTTGFPIDREGVACALGFPALVEVAYDAVSSRDDAHEAVAALAILMTGLSRLATDLQTWSTMEYGFIELADAFSSVSSIMPQKKNPQGLEYAKAAAAAVTGALATVLACSKNTSFSDVNDGVTALNLPALEACERTAKALAVLASILRTLQVRPEIMQRSAAIGFGTATELADVIVRESGLSFRMAHNIVGRVVREAIAAGRLAVDITSDDLDQAARALFSRTLAIPSETVRRALDPRLNIETRNITGGPAPKAVLAMARRRAADLDRDGAAVAAIRARIDMADAALLGAAGAMAAPSS